MQNQSAFKEHKEALLFARRREHSTVKSVPKKKKGSRYKYIYRLVCGELQGTNQMIYIFSFKYGARSLAETENV